MKNCLLFLLILSFSLTSIPNRNLREGDSFIAHSQKLAPASSFAFSEFEQSLLTEAGTPYSVYGVFGTHKTTDDGIARIEQLEKIFNLASKTNKKIIFFEELFFDFSIDALKKYNPAISRLSQEYIEEVLVDLFLSKDPEKILLLEALFRNSFFGQRKSRKKEIESRNEIENLIENLLLQFNCISDKQKKEIRNKVIGHCQYNKQLAPLFGDSYYQKELIQFLMNNRFILEKSVEEHEVLNINTAVKIVGHHLRFLYFLKKASGFALKRNNLDEVLNTSKKAIYSLAQATFLRDKEVAEWIQKNIDDKKIIIYERGTAHAYFGLLKKTLGEKHKMIVADRFAGKIDQKIWSKIWQIVDAENVLNTSENEALILKYIGFHICTFSFKVDKDIEEADEIINSLTREQIEEFLKQNKFHALGLERLRNQKKNHIPLSQPCEIAL